MKIQLLICASCLMIASLVSLANDQPTQPRGVASAILPFVEESAAPLPVAAPLPIIKKPPVMITMLTLEPGTLKENIERINQTLPYPWDIKWKGNNDYRVIGSATVMGKDLYEALDKILQYYPLRAEFYTKNHVLLIVPGSAS